MELSNNFNSEDPIEFGEMFIGILVFFIILFSVSSMLSIPLFFFVYFFSFKINYVFKDNEKVIEWKIIRRVDKKKLLVLQDNGLRRFITVDDILDKEIVMDLDKKKLNRPTWIYQSNKRCQTIQGLIIGIILFLLLTKIIENITLVLALFIICYLIVLHIFIVKNNDKIKEGISKQPVTKVE